MPLILVCPVCSEALKVERLPGPVACPKCFQHFPASAREVMTRELESPSEPEVAPVRRPFLLTAWMGVSAISVVKLAIMLVATLVMPGPLHVNGAALSGAGFVLRFFIPMAGMTVLTGATVYGIWKERPWTRRVLLASWLWFAVSLSLLAFAGPATASVTYPASFVLIAWGSRLMMVLLPLLGFVVTAWYLYRKPNVAAYFDAIERGQPRA